MKADSRRWHWTPSRMCESDLGFYGSVDAHLADKKAALAAKDAELLGDLNRREIAHGKELTAALEAQAEEHAGEMSRLDKVWCERNDALRVQHDKELADARGELLSLDRQIAEEHGEPALIQFEHPALIGEPCMIHRDYKPRMSRLCHLAETCDVKIWVTHSVRYLDQEMLDLVVKRAKRSNHLAGSGVDMNPVYEGVWYTSEMMKDRDSLPLPVWRFLSAVTVDPNLRWGGAFGVNKDRVHVDSDLVRRDPDEWARRVGELQDGV